MNRILEWYDDPMEKFMDLKNANLREVKECLGKIFKDGKTRNLMRLVTGYDYEHSIGDVINVQIAYSCVPLSGPWCRRQYITWKNIGGQWKIVAVDEKEFCLADSCLSK